MLGIAVNFFGPKNVLVCGLSRTDDTVLIATTVDDKKFDGDTIVNLPDGIVVQKLDNIDDPTKIEIETNPNYVLVATIERRNGKCALVADSKATTTAGFPTLVQMITQRKTPTFDTAFAHTPGEKSTWVGTTNKPDMKLLTVEGMQVSSGRFGSLGLILSTPDDTRVQMVNWKTLGRWTKSPNAEVVQNGNDTEVIYNTDGNVRSLSHINGDALVVNTDDGQITLDLESLNTDGESATLVATHNTGIVANFVGDDSDTIDMSSYVPYVGVIDTSTVVSLRPVAEMPTSVRGAYYPTLAAV